MEKFESEFKTEHKENVLVWLDFDAYSYINFGIINALSKLDDFNFIGIITTKQDVSFFKNQQLIQFKKLLFYPDCYINKSSFDVNVLKQFEEKYDLKLWLDIFTERSFYKYWTDFHKFTRDEILSIVENSLHFFKEILDNYKPKLILMQHPGENISNLLLYRLAKNLGFKILIPNPIYIHNKIVISDNIENDEILKTFNQLMNDFKNNEKIYDENFIKKESLTETVNVQSSYNFGTSNFAQKIKHYIKRISHDPEPIYKNIGKTKLNMIKYKYKNYFEIKNRKKFLDKNAIKLIEDEKIFYFPLQSEPEAKILTTSPFYSNQIELIESIAKSIPIDFTLYVKEHPIQKVKLWRSINDYKKIISIPNVKFIHPDVNSQELISKSHGIISISGATGFEALFYKKPVIIFADEFYEGLSSVTKVKKFSELSDKIRNTLSNFQFNNKELNVLMKSLEINSISIPYFSIIKDGIVLSSIQRYENNINLTLENFKKFYETYKKSFELMATTIYAKL
ncbi:Hypothetical protein Nlim_2054 [Candidatus Nitrosarchaeum limnium SFB1]|jgi:CRISPR/Cas system CMR subunit Cmr4 (Cas7 group RAMP superfamily)|uniref:Capsule polysaccharide biosynthesis protein n=1 Tax=Candidatus Nitrosarchaeum limnium SFB1 TaxID=886738 RepID=F3KN10_9ARCH|nr:Hypothetical protein Nlim_2054 [Candidatus Nitrosarchaeum limnium SFB1]